MTRQPKGFLVSAVFLVLVLALVLSGCNATPAAAPTAAPKAAPTSAPAAAPTAVPAAPKPTTAPVAAAPTAAPAAKPAVAPVVLKFSDPSASGTARTDAQEWWASEIEKRTEGRVKIQFYWSESLAKARDNISATQGGIADISFLASWGYLPSDFPVWQFSEMPAINRGKELPHMQAVKEMYNTVPELKQEADKTGLKLIGIIGLQPTQIMSKKPLVKLEDFKGQRIRSVGAIAEWVKAIGGTPSSITIYETYEALQKGTVDGTQGYLYQFVPYKWPEVAKNLNTTGLQTITCSIWMNGDVWKKLAPQDQKVFEDMWEQLNIMLQKKFDEGAVKDFAALKAAGVTVTEPTAENASAWRESAKFTWEKYLTAMKAKNIDGQKILDKYQELYKKYDK